VVVFLLFFFFFVWESRVMHMGMVPEDMCRAGDSKVAGEISSGGSIRRVAGEVWCSSGSPATPFCLYSNHFFASMKQKREFLLRRSKI
jgi:hypothetical protein